jgi:hypothetical protein
MQRRPHANGTEGGTEVPSNGAESEKVGVVVAKKPVIKKKRRKHEAIPAEHLEIIQIGVLLGLCMACGIYASYQFYLYFVGTSPSASKIKARFGAQYKIPDALADVGDKSRAYAFLRQEIDDVLPPNAQRSLTAVSALHKRTYKAFENDGGYDVYHCPEEPPDGYPFAWPILDVLDHWPPDDPTPHLDVHQGLCVFDFQTDYDKVMTYRNAEVPYVVRNDPEVARSVERWNYPGYMERLMSNVPHRTEYSPNNHFMYWVKPNPKPRNKKRKNGKNFPEDNVQLPSNWTQPTEMLRMKYTDWLEHANVTDDSKLGPNNPHWYYRLIGCGSMGDCDRGSSEYLFDELVFFQPKEGLYMVEPEKQKGIHCRFGMKGVIAENHFDGSRNAVVVLGGERRYILSHPDQCSKLALFANGHPSARHSAVDWSNPDLGGFPQFHEAKVNEVVMQAGDLLYLPTNWFHYIISLELNFQCNTRSGINDEYMDPIHQCGF